MFSQNQMQVGSSQIQICQNNLFIHQCESDSQVSGDQGLSNTALSAGYRNYLHYAPPRCWKYHNKTM